MLCDCSTPFLSTGIRKRVDNIGLSIGGFAIIPAGTNIIPEALIPLRPSAPECNTPEQRAEGCEDMGAIATRRRLRWEPDEGCTDLSVYLIDQSEGGVSVNFGLDLGAVGEIKGYFRISPTLVIGLLGAFCMAEMNVQLGLDIKIGVEGEFELSAEILLFRGGLALQGSVLGLEFGPFAKIDLKTMEVQPRLDMALKLISIAMQAWFQAKTCVKWCCETAFGIKACVPCGLNWCGRDSWDFGRVTVGGDGKRRDVLKMLSPDRGDKTPPNRGGVRVTQISSTTASVKFGNFTEMESDIVYMLLTFRRGSSKGPKLLSKMFDGEAEFWSGKLSSTPSHGQRVLACVAAHNSYGLSTTVCSDPIVWDSIAPIMKQLFTVNPFTGNWRIPDCSENCIFSVPPIPLLLKGPLKQASVPCASKAGAPGSCRAWTNVSTSFRFAIRISGYPANEPAKSVMWALSLDAPCRSVKCTEGTLLTPFVPVGYPARLASGQYWVPVLEMRAENLQMVPGRSHYVNLHACDRLDNCAVSGHTYPILIDETPPLAPVKMMADRMRVTSTRHSESQDVGVIKQYWVSGTRIDPLFVFDQSGYLRDSSGKLTSTSGLKDPDSGTVEAFVNMYKLRPRHPEGREWQGRFDLTKRTEGSALIRTPPFLHASSKLHGLSLELGSQYVLQLVQINPAGGTTKWTSERITADWTTPVCTPPTVVVEAGQPMVAPFASLPGASPYFGTRVSTWLRSTATEISVDVNVNTCEDPESSIHTVEMWVGSKQDGVDDLIPRQEVQLGTIHKLPVAPNLDFKDRMYCKQCGDDIVIGVRCINYANVSRACRPYAVVRVGTSSNPSP